MPAYSPTITISTTPAVSIDMVGNLSYNEFVNMLGFQVFKVKQLFLEANSFAQLRVPYTFNIFDASGTIRQEVLKPRPDPYQKQPAIYLSTRDNEIILNGQSSFAFDILPGEQLTLELCSDMKTFGQLPSGFKNSDISEDPLGNLKLFETFNDCV